MNKVILPNTYVAPCILCCNSSTISHEGKVLIQACMCYQGLLSVICNLSQQYKEQS